MTFLEMQTDALDLLQEIDKIPNYSLTKLKHYINQGCILFARRTRCIEDTVLIATVANQVEYTETDASDLANILIPYHVRYVDGTELGRPLKTWPGGYTNLPKQYNYGTPYFYWLRNVHAAKRTDPDTYEGVSFGTWPICAPASKVIRINAFMKPTKLVDDTGTVEFKEDWHDAPVYYAVYRLFQMFSHLRVGWDKKAKENISLFDRVVSDAIEDMSVQSDEPIETEDVYHQMDNWYEY